MRLSFSIILVWLVLAMQSVAQVSLNTTTDTSTTEVTLPDPLTPEAANALISRLSDTEVRALLLNQLNTQATAETANKASSLGDFFYHATVGASSSITAAVERLPILFTRQGEAFSNFAESMGGTSGLWSFLVYMLLCLGAGLIAELIFRQVTKKFLQLPPNPPENMGLAQTLSMLFKRMCTEIFAVVIFVLVARWVGSIIMPAHMIPVAGLIGPYLIGLPRLLVAITRFNMAPNNPAYRIVHTDDKTAKGMVFHMFFFGLLMGLSMSVVQFNNMHGIAVGETRLGFWLNLSVHIYVAVIAWQYRNGLVKMMRGRDPEVTPIEERVARAYPYFVIAVSMSMWWVVNIVISQGNFRLISSQPHYKTMALLIFAPTFDTAIRGLVRHLVPPMSGEGPLAERAYQSTLRSYTRIGRVLVFGLVLIFIAGFWGMDPQSLATAGVGERFAAHLIEALMILSIGYLIYEVVSLWINRKLAAEMTAAGVDPNDEEIGGGEGGGAGGSRLSTVLPLILATARVVIVIVFVLLALGNIGVDTTPLLAGAGIVGLAVGFGAQKLVTDVVSGVFFLVDDAFRTGEYVEVDGTMGTVEKISIRSMQLRHHKGPVHTIPYGEIPKLTNYSRDWVIMKLRFTVPFDTDPNKVKKIFKRIGQEMMEVPEFAEDFLQPFKSQGVFEIDDVGMVIRGKFMAKPGKQFTLRKEIYNRVKAAFTENGIDFARREVRVALPSLDGKEELTEEDKAVISAAATQAAEELAVADQSAPKPGD